MNLIRASELILEYGNRTRLRQTCFSHSSALYQLSYPGMKSNVRRVRIFLTPREIWVPRIEALFTGFSQPVIPYASSMKKLDAVFLLPRSTAELPSDCRKGWICTHRRRDLHAILTLQASKSGRTDRICT